MASTERPGQDPLAAVAARAALVEHHPAERQVVVHGRDQPAGGVRERRLAGLIRAEGVIADGRHAPRRRPPSGGSRRGRAGPPLPSRSCHRRPLVPAIHSRGAAGDAVDRPRVAPQAPAGAPTTAQPAQVVLAPARAAAAGLAIRLAAAAPAAPLAKAPVAVRAPAAAAASLARAPAVARAATATARLAARPPAGLAARVAAAPVARVAARPAAGDAARLAAARATAAAAPLAPQVATVPAAGRVGVAAVAAEVAGRLGRRRRVVPTSQERPPRRLASRQDRASRWK